MASPTSPLSGPARTSSYEQAVGPVLRSPRAQAYIQAADEYLAALGYTEHGLRHSKIVSATAWRLLSELGYSPQEAALAAVAGLLHDVGNMLGRSEHHRSSALLAKDVLQELHWPLKDITTVMNAIIVHEEPLGAIPNPVAAALLIADKADVHRSRVRNPSQQALSQDIHDRVNFAATEATLAVEAPKRLIGLSLTIDTRISPVMEYFEIFLSRMKACRQAAQALRAEFRLYINGTRMA